MPTVLFRHAAAAAFIALAPLAAFAQQGAQPGSTLKATHGAWEIRCDVNAPENCILTQVGNRADGQPALRVALRSTPGAKGPNGVDIAAVIQIDAPLGVFLPAGVEVKIDGAEIGRAAFQVCDSRACIASEPVPADFIDKMKKGNAATMTIMALNGEKAEIAISLSGFTKGFNSL